MEVEELWTSPGEDSRHQEEREGRPPGGVVWTPEPGGPPASQEDARWPGLIMSAWCPSPAGRPTAWLHPCWKHHQCLSCSGQIWVRELRGERDRDLGFVWLAGMAMI